MASGFCRASMESAAGRGGSVSDGAWDRGVPVDAGRGDPSSDADGSGSCFLTDNSAADGGNSDIDGGVTTLTSPPVDLSAGARISYAYWLNDVPNGELDGEDAMTVELSFDGGATWQEARRYRTAQASWREDTILVEAPLGSTNGRVRFGASDLGTGNVVEAGLDAFAVRRAVCVDAQQACGPADLAEPFGVLDLTDISAFVTAFAGQASPADLAEPFGVFDLSDISAFVTDFQAGCP